METCPVKPNLMEKLSDRFRHVEAQCEQSYFLSVGYICLPINANYLQEFYYLLLLMTFVFLIVRLVVTVIYKCFEAYSTLIYKSITGLL